MSMETVTDPSQYLTFELDQEVFALDVAKVREILEENSITKVPQTPDFVRGVINLRGSVLPVIDLRLKFGLSAIEKTINSCIIVVEVLMDEETVILGALADSVREVVEMEPAQIEAPPRMGARHDTGFIRGMGKVDGRFIMILDIDRVLTGEELAAVTESSL